MVSVISMCCRSGMCIRSMIRMSMPTIASSDFMELYPIGRCLILGPIKSYMREIVPDGECYSRDDIGKEELVEHEEDTEWQDDIPMTHDIGKYG
jgi:hypothetical protein